MINLENKIKMHGAYRTEISRNGIIIESSDWHDNIITDYGLNRLGTLNGGAMSFCRVGTGTVVPAITDVSLNAQIANTSNGVAVSNINTGSPLYQNEATFKYTFLQGDVIGNISEFGLGVTASGNDLFSRCLFIDSGGNPTTITLLAIDQLTVYYKLTIPHPGLIDSTGSFNISGEIYNFTSRPAHAGSFLIAGCAHQVGFQYTGGGGAIIRVYNNTSNLGPITYEPAATSGGVYQAQAPISLKPYVDGSKECNVTYTANVNSFNLTGGIQALLISCTDKYYTQYLLDKPIPKDNTKTLVLNYKYSWGR